MKYILNNNDKFEIVGKQYLEGVGGYDGTDTNNAKDVASVLKGLLNATCPNDEIWYTSTDGNIVTPYATNVFGANIVSNTYSDGKGVIRFDGSVTSIGEYAFQNCTSLTSVTIGNSVTSIGDYAFYYCRSLKSITIPDSVTSIGRAAFMACTSLTSATIGNGVTSIGNSIFNDCNSMRSIYCKPTTPPTLYEGLFGYTSIRKIYVPIESVDAYKTASGWSDYADDIVGCVFEDEALVSGENIKTINGKSILGSGDITISGGYVPMSNTWYDSPSSVTIAPNSSTEIADLGLTSIAINLTEPTDNSVVNTYTLIIRKFGFGNAFTFDKTIFWANDNAPVFDTTASDEFVEISIKRTFEGYYLGTWAKYSKYSV